jgi:hypothetical protein
MVVVDDGKLKDLKIVFSLWIAQMCQAAHKADLNIPDMAFLYPMLWEDEIDYDHAGIFLN